MRAWMQAQEKRRRTVYLSDIEDALSASDMFKLSTDITPREGAYPTEGDHHGEIYDLSNRTQWCDDPSIPTEEAMLIDPQLQMGMTLETHLHPHPDETHPHPHPDMPLETYPHPHPDMPLETHPHPHPDMPLETHPHPHPDMPLTPAALATAAAADLVGFYYPIGPQAPTSHISSNQCNTPRTPLDEAAPYANSKQPYRIVKRRFEHQKPGDLRTSLKSFRHESRHNLAMRRPRGPGGRFLSKEEIIQMEVDKSVKKVQPKSTRVKRTK
ncbi:hypothetical protein EJ04DRAFT_516512 [Polyplosphaeria fusca]|uniref:Transcriptional activator HAP2 n=1 Tax=Polyplosphaeria fusca TaxID=682080 RepID=A0A9P4QJP5_9PLEO|nr:hypothetical protein EJ04DRAFT_516512 [Polyplosphaeria fusca]